MIDEGGGDGRMLATLGIGWRGVDAADVPDLVEPYQIRQAAFDQLRLTLRACGKAGRRDAFEKLDQRRIEVAPREKAQISADKLIERHHIYGFGGGGFHDNFSLIGVEADRYRHAA